MARCICEEWLAKSYGKTGGDMRESIHEFRKLPEGAKVWFDNEKQGYTIRASNVAFCICTKPFNAKKTVLYCIIDWERDIRGPEDLLFGMGAETDEDCNEMLERITDGKSEVSGRHGLPLNIVKYYNPETKDFYKELHRLGIRHGVYVPN